MEDRVKRAGCGGRSVFLMSGLTRFLSVFFLPYLHLMITKLCRTEPPLPLKKRNVLKNPFRLKSPTFCFVLWNLNLALIVLDTAFVVCFWSIVNLCSYSLKEKFPQIKINNNIWITFAILTYLIHCFSLHVMPVSFAFSRTKQQFWRPANFSDSSCIHDNTAPISTSG